MLKVAIENDQVWHKWTQSLESRILNEMAAFNDIALVNVVDVYRNLPDKLLNFFVELVRSNSLGDAVLKTDDDCYLNLVRISQLMNGQNMHNVWFGKYWKDLFFLLN